MKVRPFFLLVALLLFAHLLSGPAAQAQVVVRANIGFPPPRPYYGPRYYYPPRPAVVYAVPPPVLLAPAPYCAPRPVYYAPRPYYGRRGRGYYGRRW